jgi:hypothetical protein
MKFLLTALLSVTLASKVFSFTVHTSYDATSDYALGDIVPSSDANVLFYQAIAALTKDTHQLTNTSQWKAWASSDIPNSGNAPTEDVPESSPTESAPTSTPPTGAIGQVAIDDPDLAETSTGTRIINISTRGKVVGSEDDDALVGGFVVRGTPGSTIRLIIRGLGPYMSSSIDSSLLLADPILEIRDNKGQVIATNDNWKTRYSSTDPDPATTLNDGNYAIYTTSFAGVGLQDNEAGVLLDLPIWDSTQAAEYGGNAAFAGYGIYTAVVKGVGGTTGIGQVAIDDPDLTENGSGNRIINISTRGFVGTGNFEDLVGGFVIRGPVASTKNFVVRGLGPYMALTTGSDIFVTDPFMRVEKSGALLSNNDNWKERYSSTDPDPSTTLNDGSYPLYTTSFSGVGLQDKESGLLLNLDIDDNGYGIYSNSVKYTAP